MQTKGTYWKLSDALLSNDEAVTYELEDYELPDQN